MNPASEINRSDPENQLQETAGGESPTAKIYGRSEPAAGSEGGGGQWPTPAGRPRRKAPWLAAVFSLIPGLGQVYVGHYQRGFLQVIVAGSTLTLMSSKAIGPFEPLGALFISFFFMYSMIDAARLASFYNQAMAGHPVSELPAEMLLPSRGGALSGGIVLIGFGLLLLLHTLFGMPLDWIRQWWPLAPVGFGIWLVHRALHDRKR